MKNFLLALIPNLTTKAAVTAAVCVVSGAAVTATATGVIYSHKTAEYRSTIERLEAQQEEYAGTAAGENGTGGPGQGTDTAVRVVDGILEVWDGTQWVDYGSVDDVEASDPYRENDDRKEETERSVASKKLAELGLTINENGEIVAADPETANTVITNNGVTVLVGNNAKTANNNATAAVNNAKVAAGSKGNAADAKGQSNTAAAGSTPEQVMAAIQSGMKTGTQAATQTISSLPQSTSPSAGVTNVSWTASPDPYGGDSDGGGSSGGSGSSGGGGGSSYSAPSDSGGGSGGGGGGESSHEEHHEEHHEESHEESHDDSSSSSDSGGSSDSGSSSEGDGFSEDYL